MTTNIHTRFDGPIVIIGFGSISRGLIPLLERHIAHDKNKLVVVAPVDNDFSILEERGVRVIKIDLTRDNFRDKLKPLLTHDQTKGLIINLAVNVSSLDVMTFAKEIDCHYIDTAIELWPDYYDNPALRISERTDYTLRESVLALERARPGGATAITCCGANPGAVSWFAKQALINLAEELCLDFQFPSEQAEWARLAQQLGVKGIHIAERDTQQTDRIRSIGSFVNTWSVEAFTTETLRPAELGWGTHEKSLPTDGRVHEDGCGASIYLLRAGGRTRVRSWTPTAGPQQGLLITHNESTSIADYLTVREASKVVYRPTCVFAYRPCDDAILSLNDMCDAKIPDKGDWYVLDERSITTGVDELGVLLYGHARNAYWYGSSLSIDEARKRAPYQNATTLQVTSAVIAGIVWMLENPRSGIVDTDRMDFRRCLQIQKPYLGHVLGKYTNWTPIDDRNGFVPEQCDLDDPWQFSNMIVR